LPSALLILFRALVISKLDYCNSVLAGASEVLLRRFRSILNAAAWMVFSARKPEHTLVVLITAQATLAQRVRAD